MNSCRSLLLLLGLCCSFSASAGYICELNLTKNEDLSQSLAVKTIRVEQGQMASGNLGTLLLESQKGSRRISLAINGLMSSESLMEKAAFVIIRQTERNGFSKNETVSRVMELQGPEARDVGRFEAYALVINCKVL